ncbi:MAG TPA: DUF21 domain-containing protein [Steroidobacteraceae bacterium]|jgi:hypothetical protein
MPPRLLAWLGILACLSQAALMSGLNLAVFSVSRLRLEIEASAGDAAASRVLDLRRDTNLTLSTIIWGNVAANVLLTLLSHSVLMGVTGFVFSTVLITCLGEIAPQAYFSRHAQRTIAPLVPVLKLYRLLLYPVAKPTALLLDWWLGPEAIAWLRERDFRALITQHLRASVPEIGAAEGLGAVNFLDLDDIPVGHEGAPLDPASVIELPFEAGQPRFPDFRASVEDQFLRRVQASGKRWVVITNPRGEPQAVLDAHRFLRDALLGRDIDPHLYVHAPIILRDAATPLGKVLGQLTLRSTPEAADVLDHDVILLWARGARRIVTGPDLLGRLLRGIAQR